MVYVDVKPEDVRALDALYEDAKVPIPMGTILGLFRARIQEAFIKEQDKQLKGKYAEKDKPKEKSK